MGTYYCLTLSVLLQVQKPAQYTFLHHAVECYLRKKRNLQEYTDSTYLYSSY